MRNCKKCYVRGDFTTLKECFFNSCRKSPNNVACIQIKSKTEEESVTYAQMYDNVVALGAKLLDMGLKGEKIALVGENSIEWLTSYLSVVCGTGVAVPIDKELDRKTMALQIDFSDSVAVFVSGKNIKRAKHMVELCPKVKYWIVMRPQFAEEIPEGFIMFDDLVKAGLELPKSAREDFENAEVLPDDLCDVIFTSGTTGANKGVMLSHKNISFVVKGSMARIKIIDRSFSCLPINHAYEKNCHVFSVLACGRTICINDDLKHIAANVVRYNAAVTTMVPMMLETIERRVKNNISKSGLKAHFDYGIKWSAILRKFHIDNREKFFKPVLDNFGSNFRQIVVGGAPLKDETYHFFDNVGFSIVNGYGISECAPLVACNCTDYQKSGSVGCAIDGCEIKIENPDENGDGIIFVRGDNVMKGYYKDEESTKKVLSEDGWFDTGDIGHMDSKGYLYITGRAKNLIILSNGKNVHPEEVEDLLCDAIPYIKEVVVYADDNGKGIYASAYLDEKFISDNKVENPYEYLMRDIKVFNTTIPPYKKIQNVTICDKEFEKTSTQKIQRFKVEKVC